VQRGVGFEFAQDQLHGDRFRLGFFLLPGYAYRKSLTPSLWYSFGIGAGPYLFTVYEDVPASARWAPLVRERMQLKSEPFPESQFLNLALGPTVTFGVLPGGEPRVYAGATLDGRSSFNHSQRRSRCPAVMRRGVAQQCSLRCARPTPAASSFCATSLPEFHPLVEASTDVAAGAVLICSIRSAMAGVLVLGPR
jgi:hypothetical protein